VNKPNKTELEYFIRYSLDSDKYKRYMELYDEIERLKEENTILKQTMSNNSLLINENAFLKERIDKVIGYIKSYMPNYDFDKTNLIKVLDILKGVDKE